MSKRITIEPGMRSGRIVAVELSDQVRNHCRLWRCRCDCGKELFLEPYKISGCRVRNCGCVRRGRKMQDITGERFGRLVAMERLPEKRGSGYLWRCRCDCGEETVATVNQLRNGGVTSCGCARRDALRNRSKDISGQEFGRLTAIEPLTRRSQGSVVWKCRCDCGRECEVSYNSLMQGNTKSCGCMKTDHKQLPLHYVDGTCVELLNRDKPKTNNTSGCTGVIATKDGRWIARIQFKKKRYALGTYDKYEEAVKARKRAEEELFEPFLLEYYNTQPKALDMKCNKRKKSAHQPVGKQGTRL